MNNAIKASEIFKACVDGDACSVSRLLFDGVDVNTVFSFGDTLLHCIAQSKNTEIAKLLLESGADINAKNSFESTPLHIAVSYGVPEMVELLVDSGCSVEQINIKRKTPLQVACDLGHADIAVLLVARGANVSRLKKEHYEYYCELPAMAEKLVLDSAVKSKKAAPSGDNESFGL